jgi:hypothetical protein
VSPLLASLRDKITKSRRLSMFKSFQSFKTFQSFKNKRRDRPGTFASRSLAIFLAHCTLSTVILRIAPARAGKRRETSSERRSKKGGDLPFFFLCGSGTEF